MDRRRRHAPVLTVLGRVLLIMMTALAAGSLASCAPSDPPSGLLGSGKFTLSLDGRPPIPVYYVTGAAATRDAKILVVMHGVERNGAEYRNSWVDLVRDRDVVVVVPQFDDEDFPGAEDYNLGGIAEGEPVRESEITHGAFGYIEPLFEAVRERVGGSQQTFDLFGHSAGAQFVHRFVELVPHASLGVAVAANAGWYTMPDDSAAFPFGLGGADSPPFDARSAFGRRLVVLLGTDDTGTQNLRQDDDAMAQGKTRFERGHAFFRHALRQSERDGVPFNWVLQEVPGVDHDHARMARAAVRFLFGGR